MMDMVERNPDGTLKGGSVLNPGGNNGEHRKGFAPWKVRVAQLDDRYDTLKKLMDLFVFDDKGNIKPGPDLEDRHPRDVGILMVAIRGIFGDDPLKYHEAFWSRMEGTPAQTVKHEGGINYGLDERSINFIRELRSIKSSRDPEADKLVIDGTVKPDHA